MRKCQKKIVEHRVHKDEVFFMDIVDNILENDQEEQKGENFDTNE